MRIFNKPNLLLLCLQETAKMMFRLQQRRVLQKHCLQ